MILNKIFHLKTEEQRSAWRVVDASGMVLGKLATELALALRGKDKPIFTPHADAGDYVVVVNCDKVVLTGDKWEQKEYIKHTGYKGSLTRTPACTIAKKRPEYIIQHAVKGMLPKNTLGRAILKKLKVYAGPNHPHKAQVGA